MKTPMIGAALALLAACAAQAKTDAELAGPPPVATPPARIAPPPALPGAPAPVAADCAIRETKTENGIRLEATVQADEDMPGTYDFKISASGSGGSSGIAQGGEIGLTAGRTIVAGAAEIPRGRYRAVLTIDGADGELCRVVRKT